MQSRDFQRSSSAFIDGYRYNIRTLDSFLGQRFHGEKLPGLIVEATSASLATAMLKRVCRTSGLWAQFGYLCDLIVVNEKSGLARYYYDLPKDYVHANALGHHEHYYTITFEWGPWQGDIFAIDRRPSHEHAQSSAFLHPIVRRYAKTELVEEHHMLEDLFGMYCQARASKMVHRRSRADASHRSLAEFHLEEHEQPLQEFFERQVSEGGTSEGGTSEGGASAVCCASLTLRRKRTRLGYRRRSPTSKIPTPTAVQANLAQVS